MTVSAVHPARGCTGREDSEHALRAKRKRLPRRNSAGPHQFQSKLPATMLQSGNLFQRQNSFGFRIPLIADQMTPGNPVGAVEERQLRARPAHLLHPQKRSVHAPRLIEDVFVRH